MEKVNYQLILDRTIDEIKKAGKRPSLLLQCCCGPCSSYVLEYLSKYFDITVLFYNPNIYPYEEYEKRRQELIRLIESYPYEYKVESAECEYEDEEFYKVAEGYEEQPEGGARCVKCFALRLEKTAQMAKEKGFDYFSTTLTVSPHKNAQAINQLGMEIGKKYGVEFLLADFKKREGYKRSIELSKEYDLYRQDYCGCKFSLNK